MLDLIILFIILILILPTISHLLKKITIIAVALLCFTASIFIFVTFDSLPYLNLFTIYLENYQIEFARSKLVFIFVNLSLNFSVFILLYNIIIELKVYDSLVEVIFYGLCKSLLIIGIIVTTSLPIKLITETSFWKGSFLIPIFSFIPKIIASII